MSKHFISVCCLYMSFLCLFSCKEKEDALEEALAVSGSNRTQLKTVLSYYSSHLQDSLHLKAAQFLIRNMPGHSTYSGLFVRNYFHTMDSVYPEMSNVVKRAVYNIPLRQQSLESESIKRIEDIKTVKSEYLTQHINNAIEMWNGCPWLRSFTFEDFCEYVLPYRIAKEPLLENDSTLYGWKYLAGVLDYTGMSLR